MSIKSTCYLTRPEALALLEDFRSKLVTCVPRLTDEELGDMLDMLDEEVCRREGRPCFANYLVTATGRAE